MTSMSGLQDDAKQFASTLQERGYRGRCPGVQRTGRFMCPVNTGSKGGAVHASGHSHDSQAVESDGDSAMNLFALRGTRQGDLEVQMLRGLEAQWSWGTLGMLLIIRRHAG